MEQTFIEGFKLDIQSELEKMNPWGLQTIMDITLKIEVAPGHSLGSLEMQLKQVPEVDPGCHQEGVFVYVS